ncbi:recombinase family protein [Rhodococcus erythropolis]|uniref:recombinase family protein n=1 Tax=Rhodococcus erythropolis TaxID=1833 RepID=UPI00366EB7B4
MSSVVCKLDRFGGSACHVIDTVRNLCEGGIAFCFLTEGSDISTADGEFLTASCLLSPKWADA